MATVLFRKIAADIAEQIHSGVLPPGSRLPTERALAHELGVNRGTVAVALADLEAAGLVERRQGTGTYSQLPGLVRAQGLAPTGAQGAAGPLPGGAAPTLR